MTFIWLDATLSSDGVLIWARHITTDIGSDLYHIVIWDLLEEARVLPWFYLETATHNASHQMGANTAVAGTLIYEWHRLSDLTGDPKYRDLADRAEAHLLHPKPEPLYPDLVGSNLDMTTGEFTTNDVSWKSGIDSFYEVRIYLCECVCTHN